MVTSVNGFKLEVTLDDDVPHVRISLEDGTVVLETNRVSLTGLERLPAVFETAASVASRQLEQHYRQLHYRVCEDNRRARSSGADTVPAEKPIAERDEQLKEV
jgi:hypothetical protein